MMPTWCDNVRQIINAELHQICHLARLAILAPDEAARNMVLHLISEELHEAMFWNNVLCSTCDPCAQPYPETGMQPGMFLPGMGPDMGAGAGFGPEMGFMPVMGGPCPLYTGVTCPGFCPGMPCHPIEPCPTPTPVVPTPSPPIGIGPSIGTSPGVNIGSDTFGGPGMLPGPGMAPGPGMGMGPGMGIPAPGAGAGGGVGMGPGGIFGPGTTYGPNLPSFGSGTPIFNPGVGIGTTPAIGPITSGGPIISPSPGMASVPEAAPSAAEKDKEQEKK
ncbi:hypothetical protein ACOBQJ_16180 [Pelotomaculum propionicicum]|uniref:hypothetical protein n=1 Tax=Pelotomaculum propionicicum TaxID=258475 RepID=UPI003B7D7251